MTNTETNRTDEMLAETGIGAPVNRIEIGTEIEIDDVMMVVIDDGMIDTSSSQYFKATAPCLPAVLHIILCLHQRMWIKSRARYLCREVGRVVS